MLGAAEHALAEVARGQQVAVVLERDPVAAGELPDLGLDALGQHLGAQAVEVGLADVAEPVARRRARRTSANQSGSQNSLRSSCTSRYSGPSASDRDLALEQRAVGVGGRHPLLLEELVQLLRLRRAGELVAGIDVARVPEPGVAQHAPEVAAGLRVVGDVGDPVRREAGGERRHQRVARVRRDPAVDAVGDDVVELAERAVGQVAHVALAQLDVASARSRRSPRCRRRSAPLRGRRRPRGCRASPPPSPSGCRRRRSRARARAR